MKKLIIMGVLLVLITTPLFASLQSVLNGITVAPVPGSSSVNVATDTIPDGADAYWSITGSGQSAATLIIELAGFAPTNSFGVFDMSNPASMVQIFSGAAVAGSQAVLSIHIDGSVFVNFVDTGIDFAGNQFGYYLDATIGNGGPAGLFYSDTTLNADALDHMFAVQGKNIDTVQLPGLAPGLWVSDEYVLGWEDLVGGGDLDYDDFVVMVESVHPIIPAPGAILLGGIGVCLVGWLRRKRVV